MILRVASVILAACGGEAASCRDVDCPAREVCVDGACVPEDASPDGGVERDASVDRDGGVERDASVERDGGVERDGAVELDAASTDFCARYYDGVARPVPTAPQFRAHGFEGLEVAFETIWGAEPGISGSGPVTVPGNFLNPVANRYLTVPIRLTAPARQVNLAWLESQGVGIQSANLSITVSACPGDFRPSSRGAEDSFLGFPCRPSSTVSFSGTLSIAVEGEGLGGCQIPPDTTVYLNIAPHDMFQESAPAESTCGDSPVCGLAFTIR